jgi:hypothetical protein
VTNPEPRAGLFPWVLRGILVVAALAAPIVVFRGFTDPDTPDPVKQQRLREVSRPPARPATTEPAIPRQ